MYGWPFLTTNQCVMSNIMLPCVAFCHVPRMRSRIFNGAKPVPMASPESQGKDNTCICDSSPPIEEAISPHVGRPTGGGLIQGIHDSGYIPDKVGVDFDGWCDPLNHYQITVNWSNCPNDIQK